MVLVQMFLVVLALPPSLGILLSSSSRHTVFFIFPVFLERKKKKKKKRKRREVGKEEGIRVFFFSSPFQDGDVGCETTPRSTTIYLRCPTQYNRQNNDIDYVAESFFFVLVFN